jgi:exopolysaccharide production protein ExoY
MPVMVVIAAAVAMDGGPVIYRHRRIGRDGKAFDCLKFRTMILDAEDCLNEYLSYHPEESGEWERERKLSHDPRITPIGRLLRTSSADELPQLLNVIAGSMSLVGPRPVTASELALYGESAELYKSVRPGITGPWQISGRNDLSYDTRVLLDTGYVREWSLQTDLRVLLQTPTVVLSRSGAR